MPSVQENPFDTNNQAAVTKISSPNKKSAKSQ